MANRQTPVLPDPNAIEPDPNAEPTVDPATEDMSLRVVSCESFIRTQAKGGGIRYRSVLKGSDAAIARFKATQGQYFAENDGEPLYISQEALKVDSLLVETNGRYGPKVVVSKELERLAKADFLASKAGLSEEAKGALFSQLIMSMV